MDSIARELFEAYSTGQPVAPPRLHGIDVERAYAIQRAQEQAFVAQGETVTGRKIGLTSVAMQRQLGVDSPDVGFFTDAMMYDPGVDIPASRFIAPKIEPELAFRLNRDLSGDMSMDDVIAAVDSVHLALEIVDSRVRDWDISLVDTIADNASCGAVIIAPDTLDIEPQELADVPVELRINHTTASAGRGADVMGHPLAPIQWLAGFKNLRAGEVILTGSMCAAANVSPGDVATADYGQWGSLEVTFS